MTGSFHIRVDPAGPGGQSKPSQDPQALAGSSQRGNLLLRSSANPQVLHRLPALGNSHAHGRRHQLREEARVLPITRLDIRQRGQEVVAGRQTMKHKSAVAGRPIGDMPPAEYEARYYEPPAEAGVN